MDTIQLNRIGERTYEATPTQLGISALDIAANTTFTSKLIDMRGAKYARFWCTLDQVGEFSIQVLAEDGTTVLADLTHDDLVANTPLAVLFAPFAAGDKLLPAFYFKLKIKNASANPGKATCRGLIMFQ